MPLGIMVFRFTSKIGPVARSQLRIDDEYHSRDPERHMTSWTDHRNRIG